MNSIYCVKMSEISCENIYDEIDSLRQQLIGFIFKNQDLEK